MTRIASRKLCLFLPAILIAWVTPVWGAEKNAGKSLSVGLSFGFNSNLGGLETLIKEDGMVALDGTSMLADTYRTENLFPATNQAATLSHASTSTASPYNLIESAETGEALTGMEIGFVAQYELDKELELPLWTRLGFYHTFSVAGGSNEITLGDVASSHPAVASVLTSSTPSLSASDYDGGKLTYEYGAGYSEIPITIGFKLFASGQSFLYAGIGVSFFTGSQTLTFTADEKYANAAMTHVDTTAGTATNYHTGGSVSDEIELSAGGVALHYILGVQWDFLDGIVVFIELNQSGLSKEVYSNRLQSGSAKLISNARDEELAGADSEWLKRLRQNVNLGGTDARFGVKYYIF